MTNNETLAAPAMAPTGKWRALLICSLALNLLVVGIAAGSVWRHRHHHNFAGGGGRGTEEIGLRSFLKTLPPERAKELRTLIKSAKPELKPLFDATRAARRTAADAMSAEPFDKDKLTGAFGKIDEAEAAMKAAARSVITNAASQMTAAERLALAERWKARRAKFFRGTTDDDKDDAKQDEKETP